MSNRASVQNEEIDKEVFRRFEVTCAADVTDCRSATPVPGSAWQRTAVQSNLLEHERYVGLTPTCTVHVQIQSKLGKGVRGPLPSTHVFDC